MLYFDVSFYIYCDIQKIYVTVVVVVFNAMLTMAGYADATA